MDCRNSLYLVCASAALIAVGCQPDTADSGSVEQPAAETDLVWAVNIGGPPFTGMDGTEYKAEESTTGGIVGNMEIVKGSQDAFLYKTYREGDIRVAHELANGTYDITFHFAEPKDYAGGVRVFDAFAEGKRVIDDLDVMASRDGKVMSALTVTAADVVVADGELNIAFEASADQPTLSALVVRDKNRPTPDLGTRLERRVRR